MTKIENYKQIQAFISDIKAYKEQFITNFFLGENKCNLLINDSLFYEVDYGKCKFLLYRDVTFYHIYFLAASGEQLGFALKQLTEQYPEAVFVVDIIGSDLTVEKFSMLFEQFGFKKHSKFFRMSRIKTTEQPDVVDLRASYAKPTDLEQIMNLLNVYFDKYSEQIPLVEEIKQWIAEKRILVVAEKDKITGFVIFEINGMTSYLRYWFTDPDYRNRKIGSTLLRHFFYECRNTKRELFWVMENNENAIARYLHYGFKPESMFDQILIKQ